MIWLIWAQHIFETIGAAGLAGLVVWKLLKGIVKLGMMLSERNLNLNGHSRRKPKLMERVLHERSEEHSIDD